MYFGWSCMSRRQPDTTINARAATAAKKNCLPLSVVGSVGNGRDLPRVQRFEKAARRFQLELGILRLDAQEEAVAARQGEARHVEHRVIRLRQAVQREHAEHARQS